MLGGLHILIKIVLYYGNKNAYASSYILTGMCHLSIWYGSQYTVNTAGL